MLMTTILYTMGFLTKIVEAIFPNLGDYYVTNDNIMFNILKFMTTMFYGITCSVLTFYIL